MHKMNAPHSTLRPGTNVVLIIVWGMAVVVLLALLNPWPTYVLVVGFALGLVGGSLQIQSFKESKSSFRESKTMSDVRRSLRNTKWGKRYLYVLWAGNICLIAVAVLTTNNPLLSVLVGYFLLMFVREIITLKPSIEINDA